MYCGCYNIRCQCNDDDYEDQFYSSSDEYTKALEQQRYIEIDAYDRNGIIYNKKYK